MSTKSKLTTLCVLLITATTLYLAFAPPTTPVSSSGVEAALATDTPQTIPTPTGRSYLFVPAVLRQESSTPGTPTDTPEPAPTVGATDTPQQPFP